MLSNGILDIEDTEGEEISLTAEGPQLTEEEQLRIESEKEEGDDDDVKRIDLFASEEGEADPLNKLLMAEDGISTLFMKKGGKATKNIKGQPHMLAYITPGEAKTLENLGGQKTMTKEGIPAYPPSDNYGGDWGGSSGNNNDNQGSDQGHSRFDVGSGYYGETVTTSSDDDYEDPILEMVDKTKIPGTTEYIEEEKTDYVLMPEKKLKLSKGVRPAAVVPLATKQYYDRLDKYIEQNTNPFAKDANVSLASAYQIEKFVANQLIDAIPVVGKFLPEYYPSRNINFEKIGKYEVPGSDLGFYDPDEYPEFWGKGPDEEQDNDSVIELLTASTETIEDRDETDIFDLWDRIKAGQAKRAMLVEKDIIQDNEPLPITKESVSSQLLNNGGLANLFRVKTQ